MVYETSGSTDRVTPDQLVSELLETSLGTGVMSFVESGLTFSPNYGSDEVTVSSGVAYILGDGQGLKLTPDEVTLPLEANSLNYIFLVKPFTSFEVGYVVKTQDVPPAQPSLKIGTVDTGSDTSQELNRGAALSPDKFGNDIDADGNDITNVGTFSSDKAHTTDLNADEVALEGGSQSSSPVYPMRWATNESGAGPWEFQHEESTFNGTVDPVAKWGYDISGTQETATTYWAQEARYEESNGTVNFESYLQHVYEDGSTRRPISFKYARDGSGGSSVLRGAFISFNDLSNTQQIKFDLSNQTLLTKNGTVLGMETAQGRTWNMRPGGSNDDALDINMGGSGAGEMVLEPADAGNRVAFGVPGEFYKGGPSDVGQISFANTRLYENASGEVVVEDSAGNTTTIS